MRYSAPADGDIRSCIDDHCHELALDRKRAEWRARFLAARQLNDEPTDTNLRVLEPA